MQVAKNLMPAGDKTWLERSLYITETRTDFRGTPQVTDIGGEGYISSFKTALIHSSKANLKP